MKKENGARCRACDFHSWSSLLQSDEEFVPETRRESKMPLPVVFSCRDNPEQAREISIEVPAEREPPIRGSFLE
jgi:hypothetical protein